MTFIELFEECFKDNLSPITNQLNYQNSYKITDYTNVELFWSTKDCYYIKTEYYFENFEIEKLNHKIIFNVNTIKPFISNEKLDLTYKLNKINNNDIYIDVLKKVDNELDSLNDIIDIFSEKEIKSIISKFKKTIKSEDKFLHKTPTKWILSTFEEFYKNKLIENIDNESIFKELKDNKESYLQELNKICLIEENKVIEFNKVPETLEENYVITFNKFVDLNLLKEIINNKNFDNQELEYNDFKFIEQFEKENSLIYNKKDVFLDNNLNPLYQYFYIDTKLFNKNIKEKIINQFNFNELSLENVLDGELINGDNYKGMNLIKEKYKNKIDLCYIDPPYNTGNTSFSYADKMYKNSWNNLIENRIEMLLNLLNKNKSNLFISIDEKEKFNLKFILDNHLTFFKEIIWESGKAKGFKATKTIYPKVHETIYHYYFNNVLYFPTFEENSENKNDLTSSIFKYDKNKIYSMDFIQGAKESVGFGSGQKPEKLLNKIYDITFNENKGIVIDFFNGSSTTCVSAQKKGLKWIGIEQNHYFNNFFLNDKKEIGLGNIGRLKYCLFGDKKNYFFKNNKGISQLSKDLNWNGGGFFKYIKIKA